MTTHTWPPLPCPIRHCGRPSRHAVIGTNKSLACCDEHLPEATRRCQPIREIHLIDGGEPDQPDLFSEGGAA